VSLLLLESSSVELRSIVSISGLRVSCFDGSDSEVEDEFVFPCRTTGSVSLLLLLLDEFVEFNEATVAFLQWTGTMKSPEIIENVSFMDFGLLKLTPCKQRKTKFYTTIFSQFLIIRSQKEVVYNRG